MRTIAFAVLMLAVACGGTEGQKANETAAESTVPDVSGNYTLNQYASYLGKPGPDVVALSGPMVLFQSGGKVGGLAVLRIPNPATVETVNYLEVRNWSGTVEKRPDGSVVVRLATSDDRHFVGVLDASGNLTGSPGTTHGYCANTYLAMGCDAVR